MTSKVSFFSQQNLLAYYILKPKIINSSNVQKKDFFFRHTSSADAQCSKKWKNSVIQMCVPVVVQLPQWLKSTFFEKSFSLRVRRQLLRLEKFQKTLLLAFEANSAALSCQKMDFFPRFNTLCI